MQAMANLEEALTDRLRGHFPAEMAEYEAKVLPTIGATGGGDSGIDGGGVGVVGGGVEGQSNGGGGDVSDMDAH